MDIASSVCSSKQYGIDDKDENNVKLRWKKKKQKQKHLNER